MTLHGEIPTRRPRQGIARERLLLIVIVSLVPTGCISQPNQDRLSVSRSIESRFGTGFGAAPDPDHVLIPRELDEGRPITEEQAVLLALWNNAAFHEALVELDLTRADLVQAGLLPNPEFVYFWPGPDQAVQVPHRLPDRGSLAPPDPAEGGRRGERAGVRARLTQLALDLIRDTRQAYADLRLAHDRVRVAERAVATPRATSSKLAEARLKAGDASPLEVSTARIDALQAEQDLTPVRYEVTGRAGAAAEPHRAVRVRRPARCRTTPRSTRAPRLRSTNWSRRRWRRARTRSPPTTRPRAAAERLRIARLGWVRFLGILDATSGRTPGTSSARRCG